MLAMRVLIKPCSDLQYLVSLGRSTRTWPASCRTIVSYKSSQLSSPFGPFTFTIAPSTSTPTPDGSVIGFLPIRDKDNTPFSDSTLARGDAHVRALPDITEHFSANALFASGFVRHYPPGSRDDRYSQPPKHPGDLSFTNVDPETGFTDLFQSGNDPFFSVVLQVNFDDSLIIAFVQFVFFDIAFPLQNFSHRFFRIGGGNLHCLSADNIGVANTSQHVGNRIRHHHGDNLLLHQLALLIPGISPRWAKSRKHTGAR